MTQLTVPVTIVDDNLDEIDLENFTASLVRVTDISLVTINPELAQVIIEDNDGNVNTLKINFNSYLLCVYNCGGPVVEIGFEQTTYFATENNTREVIVCASIQSGSPALSGKSVVVALMSVDGSAIGMIIG